MTEVNESNLLDFIIDYESGQLDDQGFIALFEFLIRTGKVWSLQGSYGRTAQKLIDLGVIPMFYDKELENKANTDVLNIMKALDKLFKAGRNLLDNLTTCDFCMNPIMPNKEKTIGAYQPFDDEPYMYELCDECIEGVENDGLEGTFYCEVCDRDIYDSRGYRGNIKSGVEYNGDYHDYMCVACFQKLAFEHGTDTFEHADFYNYKELEREGFIEHGSYFCRSKESYDRVEQIFIELQEQGKKPILNIESSGMGLEHHLSIHIKEE